MSVICTPSALPQMMIWRPRRTSQPRPACSIHASWSSTPVLAVDLPVFFPVHGDESVKRLHVGPKLDPGADPRGHGVVGRFEPHGPDRFGPSGRLEPVRPARLRGRGCCGSGKKAGQGQGDVKGRPLQMSHRIRPRWMADTRKRLSRIPVLYFTSLTSMTVLWLRLTLSISDLNKVQNPSWSLKSITL